MLRRAIFFGAIMAAAWPSLAAEGDLKAVVAPGGDALAPQWVYARRRDFVEAKPGSGTVNASATVASLRVGGKVFLVAVDSTKADAKAPNVLRFDFSGKGKFAAALAVPLKAHSSPPGLGLVSGLVRAGHVESPAQWQDNPCWRHGQLPQEQHLWALGFASPGRTGRNMPLRRQGARRPCH